MRRWLGLVCGLLLAACGSSDSEPAGGTGGAGGDATDAGADADAGELPVDPYPLPESLPFDFSRQPVGTPPTSSEVTSFTQKITGFWRQVDYFRWVGWHSHGLHASYDASMPSYSLWWQDTRADKLGDTVSFVHFGGADNIMIRTPKVLAQAATGFGFSADPLMGDVTLGYSKGIVALFLGMVWANAADTSDSVMARAIFTHNHSYTTGDGRKVAVDYDPVKVEKLDWNAHTVPNPDNPSFGSIWVRNMRSKDDVPHMFRVAPVLMRLAQDSSDSEVKQAAADAVAYLRAFAKDIVDSGYQIRTREAGDTYIPEEDLASFVRYDALAPNGECNAKLTAALLGHGMLLGNDCGAGVDDVYEDIATAVNYFNYAIIRYFHLAAITNSIVFRQDAVAEQLMRGLDQRVTTMMNDDQERQENPEWDADIAAYLLAAAASGLPLTAAEARLVQAQYSAAVDHYAPWPNWDLWDASVPDGSYDYKPSRTDAAGIVYVRPEELTFLIEYCGSPWKNPAGVEPVDCSVVLDPNRWGQ